MRRIVLVVAALLGAATFVAWAGQTVSQKDKQFSVETLTVGAGETVVFSNDDQVVHDISVTKPDGSTTPGVMEKPGTRPASPSTSLASTRCFA